MQIVPSVRLSASRFAFDVRLCVCCVSIVKLSAHVTRVTHFGVDVPADIPTARSGR
jgi:hypothetical protein